MATPEDFATALNKAAFDFFKDKEELSDKDIMLIVEGTAIFLFSSGMAYQKCKEEA